MPTERLNQIIFLCTKFRPKILALENADMNVPLLTEKLRQVGVDTKVVSFDPRLDRKKITSDPRLSPRGRTKKAAQIDALEPVLRAGRVLFVRGQVSPLVQQLLRHPYNGPPYHDDVIDAFSMCLAYEEEMKVQADADPLRVYREMEEREYAMEGLDPRTGRAIDEDAPQKRRWGSDFGRLFARK
jgi:hypothetical protein